MVGKAALAVGKIARVFILAREGASRRWQAVCARRFRVVFGLLLDAAEKVPNLWIVIHGDHGSRISSQTKAETPEDLNRTFLAIRGPGVVAEKLPAPIQLQAELERFYTSLLKSIGGP